MTRRGSAARLSAVVPGAPASLLLDAVPVGERCGLDQFWVGDPNGGYDQAADDRCVTTDDRYVLTTLAVLAARTRELRLGAFLWRVADPGRFTAAETLHLAEDLSVVDQASAGRLEVAFIPGRDGWIKQVELLLSVWSDGWELGDGRVVPATPPPAQPALPRLIVGDDIEIAARLGAGRVVLPGAAAEAGVRARTVLLNALDGGVREWLDQDVSGQLAALRLDIAAVRANEVMFVLGQGSVEDDLRVLGTVVGPALRCAKDDAARVGCDAWKWLNRRQASDRKGFPPSSGATR